MEKKEQFNSVVDVTYFITFLLYAAMSVAGYLMFGSGTLEEITLNLESGVMSKLATVMTVITPMAKFALTLNPSKSIFLFPLLELISLKIVAANVESIIVFYAPTGTRELTHLSRVMLRSLLTGLTLLIALYVRIFAFSKRIAIIIIS
jgi:hypothetical protein